MTSPPVHIALNDEGHRRLVVLKQVYETALSQSAIGNTSMRMLATINFDFAIETLLKLALTSLLPQRSTPREFKPLMGEVDKALRDSGARGLAHKDEILRMHELRNNVQHHAEYPSVEQVSRIRLHCDLFIHDTTRMVWDLDFDDIDLLDAIQTADVKAILTLARQELNQAEVAYFQVIGYCWQALTTLLNLVRPLVVGQPAQSLPGTMVLNPVQMLQEDDSLNRAVELTQETTLMLALGINTIDYFRYRNIVGSMSPMWGPRTVLRNVRSGNDQPSGEEVQFVYSFSVNAVLQIENRLSLLGPLDQIGRVTWTERMITLDEPENPS